MNKTIVKVLSTGSKEGSVVYIGTGESSILIDAGPAKKNIKKFMLDNNFNPAKVDAILISHEHKDHCGGIAFADDYKIPVYASEGTLKELKRSETGKIVKHLKTFILDGLRQTFISVTPVNVMHDAAEPLMYVIQTHDTKISVMMDTGTITKDMLSAMAMSDVYILEANYDEDMLANGDYHDGLKYRVSSDTGHLSNAQTAEALNSLVRGIGEHIIITHMSAKNNTPELAEQAIKLALFDKGLVKNKHYKLEVL
ncbi:MBL fold metallo-hydrolase [Paenibacillus camelliae]|uniref:MBL fold metallo-hydrolase n=1 Tax=Paenibacillus camelliae TaxID=512410 RepID=UPI00203DF46B|nr:MBL fold metallo-hydrolase [Paenibacillus camelliae]MCM3632896.1 MBL fold metallo-hydrolase [Paenibacillus camelliae]